MSSLGISEVLSSRWVSDTALDQEWGARASRLRLQMDCDTEPRGRFLQAGQLSEERTRESEAIKH